MQKFTNKNCVKCNYPLYDLVYNYSKTNIGFALCKKCQDWYRDINPKTTWEAKKLFLALKERNIPIELEKYDGFKTIDLAIPNLKFNIEVDGAHHNIDLNQATSDLLRTMFSFEQEFITLRIPNILVRKRLNETADVITNMALKQKEKLTTPPPSKNKFEFNDFEKVVTDFLVNFYTVFESDWNYTNSYISEEGNNYPNLLGDFPDEMNWENRDKMVSTFHNLIQFMNKHGLLIKQQNEDEKDIYKSEFLSRYII